MRNDVVDKGLAGKEMFYRNVLIEDNRIFNHLTHGITVGETDGLIVRGNSLEAAPLDMNNPTTQWFVAKWGAQAGISVPKINMSPASTGVVLAGNTFAGAPWFTGSRIT